MKKKEQLQKSVPLKIVAHVMMAAAFIVLVVCFLFFIKYSDMMNGEYFVHRGSDDAEQEYFSSAMFKRRYGTTLDTFYDGLDRVLNDRDNGYPLSYYIGEDKNFKYAVYDEDGELMFASEGWKTPDPDSEIYYYSVDLNDLHLFDTDSIRRADYALEQESETPEPEAQTSGESDAEADEPETMKTEGAAPEADAPPAKNGAIEYGSNFTNFTYFYGYDEILLAGKVGYIFTYVPGQLAAGDAFYNDFIDFRNVIQWDGWMAAIGILAFLVMATSLVWLMVSAGHSRKKEGIQLLLFDKLFTELAAAILLLVILPAACILVDYMLRLYRSGDFRNADFLRIGICLAAIYAASVLGLLSLARRMKAHTLLKNSLIYKIYSGARVVWRGFVKNHLLHKYIILAFGVGIVDYILMYSVFMDKNVFWALCVMVIYICELIYVGCKLVHIQDIRKGAHRIATGDLQYKIDASEMTGIFRDFAEDINNIGNVLNAAVDERTKSERMKADLITNVSHDIKTPLTSIINYVDLMKRENITEEPMREYIEVLDMKSKRLKELTDDLVEASRVSSGNIVLDLHHIDLVELAVQAVGTYEEKFRGKGLKIVLSCREPSMMIKADGRRLYRVLDNLFNNAYKYALENTRVYVDLYVLENKACFVMKNVSSAQLNISAEELTQRFVRGDASRTTEGSGLGLSIARSLTELHGGEFVIDLDGDLFKVTLKFDLSNPQQVRDDSETDEKGAE